MLELAITSVTRKLDEASGEDPVRLFFKTQVCHLNCKDGKTVICSQLQHMDALFGELRALAESVGREHSQLRTKTMAVMECSQILLVSFSRQALLTHLIGPFGPDNMGCQ